MRSVTMRRRIIVALITVFTLLVVGGLTWAAIRDIVALKTFVGNLRDVMFSLVQIVVMLFIVTLVGMLVAWMSGKGEGTMILPFDNATGETKYDGKAISDSLIAELQRIRQIHLVEHEGIQSEELALPKLSPSKESLASSIADVGTVGVGETTVSIGRLLVTLKRLWPIGDPGSVITGSLQKYGPMIRLVARMEHREVRAWEVSRKIEGDEQIPDLVSDLAFKIAHGLSPNISAKTWVGFKYFTEALDGYDLYTHTGQVESLELARANCLKAVQAEQGYVALFGLLYNLGIAYFDRAEYTKSAEIFRHALALKRDANAFAGLDISLERLGHIDEAIAEYQRVIEHDPKGALAHSSLAACYRRLGRQAGYTEQIEIARVLMAKESEYNRACFESICDNMDEALALLKMALGKKQITLERARRDPDFDFIRDDPRFKALVGE